jgi:membrane protein EpsK
VASANSIPGDTANQPGDGASIAPREAKSYFAINVASNVAYMGLTALAMTMYIPFLIGHLGIAIYGLVPLANSLIMYMSTITDGLNVAVTRYLTIDLNRTDSTAANRTFNTALYISLIMVAIMLPVVVILTWLFPVIFRSPPGTEYDVRVLFGGVALTFFLTIIESNFAISTMVFHRFDLRNLVRGLTMITRMGSVIILMNILPARLWYIGLGFVLSALVSFAGTWQLWRKLTPQLRIRRSSVDYTRRGELLGLSGWSIVNRIGILLFYSTDLIIVNIFLGPKMTGWYGTLLLFPELLRSIVETMTSVLSPAIMARYAVHDFDGLKQLATRSVKLLALALALPVGLLCGFAQPFLSLWLGPDFQHLARLLIALLCHMSITLATLPLSYILTSYNKVRIQGLATFALGVVNLALSIILVRYEVWGEGWGAIGVAASTAIAFIIRNLLFLSSYSASVMKLPWWAYYTPLIVGAAGTLGVALCAYGFTLLLWPSSWMILAALIVAVSLIYSIPAYFVGLNSDDRNMLISLIRAPLQKYLAR